MHVKRGKSSGNQQSNRTTHTQPKRQQDQLEPPATRLDRQEITSADSNILTRVLATWTGHPGPTTYLFVPRFLRKRFGQHTSTNKPVWTPTVSCEALPGLVLRQQQDHHHASPNMHLPTGLDSMISKQKDQLNDHAPRRTEDQISGEQFRHSSQEKPKADAPAQPANSLSDQQKRTRRPKPSNTSLEQSKCGRQASPLVKHTQAHR